MRRAALLLALSLLAACRERGADAAVASQHPGPVPSVPSEVLDAGPAGPPADDARPPTEPGVGGIDSGAGLPSEAHSGAPFVEAREVAGLLRAVREQGLGLVFSSERSGAPQLHRWDGTAERALTFDAAHHLQAVALRTREAVVTRVEGPAEQLLAIDLSDAGVRELTPPMEKAHEARLSLDERLVAFESSLTHLSSIAVAPLDGAGAPSPLPPLGETGAFQPAFTRDGSRVLLTSSASGDPEIYAQPLDGGAARQLTAFHLEDFGAVPAPDGERFAFVSNREGNDRVFVQRLDGRGVVRLLAEARLPDDTERDPVWMPDGRSLLVTIRSGGVSRIARVDLSTRRVLWRSEGPDQLPRPSPDGRFIAFVSDRLGSADVFVMKANGAEATPVTQHPSAEYGPQWFRR